MNLHRNIPIFVTHQGCPQKCVFCDQKKITGKSDTTPESADAELNEFFSHAGRKETEIAFFGGSFTAIEHDRMMKYLETGKKYVDAGYASGIRLSTRPDALSDEMLGILKKYGVTAIEIGVQSLSDDVLIKTRRGHTALDSIEAMKRVKRHGFELTGQMMTGLCGSTLEAEIKTAEGIIACGADATRIYPTAVFKGTELEKMYLCGEYTPPDIEESIERCAIIAQMFIKAGVKILRIGLCSTDFSSDESYIAGGYHPSIGEMVYSRIYFNIIEKKLADFGSDSAEIIINKSEISKAIGNKGENRDKLIKKYGLKKIIFKGSDELEKYEVRINKCT